MHTACLHPLQSPIITSLCSWWCFWSFGRRLKPRETHSMDTSLSGSVSTSLAVASLFVSCLPAFKCHLHKELSELSWPMIIPWCMLKKKKKGTETKRKPWLMRSRVPFLHWWQLPFWSDGPSEAKVVCDCGVMSPPKLSFPQSCNWWGGLSLVMLTLCRFLCSCQPREF